MISPGFPPDFKLPLETRLAFFASCVFLGLLIWDQSHWWLTREEYNFGIFVPIFVGWVLVERWPAIRNFLVTGRAGTRGADEEESSGREGKKDGWLSGVLEAGAWLVLIGALALYAIGAVLRSSDEAANLPATQAWAWSFAAFLLSSAFIVSRRIGVSGVTPALGDRLKFVGLFVFPALIWMISAPLLDFAERKVSLFLLNRVTDIVSFTFELLNYPLERKGNVLVLPMGQVGVEDACSGIRSLTACLFAGSFMAAMYANRIWKKLTLIFLAMVLAFVMNIFRSLFLTAWAYAHGSEAIKGNFHDLTGYAVLGLTWVGLIILAQILNYSPDIEWEEEGSTA
ncbi:MAG: exosortase/archaeosortase family protein [Puniceicoccaceae bacterium]